MVNGGVEEMLPSLGGGEMWVLDRCQFIFLNCI
jgi:hypothetical protein